MGLLVLCGNAAGQQVPDLLPGSPPAGANGPATIVEALPPAPARPPLTLEELEAMALQNNPSIGRAQAFVMAARGNWVQVGMLPNPFAGFSDQQIGSGGRAEQPGVYFGQDIIRGGKLRLNREVAAQEISRAEQDLSAQELRVRTDVRIAFYQILIAQRQLTLSDALTDIATKSVATADALFKAKEVSRSDTLLAEIELENARIINRNSRNRFVAAWQTLSTVVGIPEMAPQPVSGDPESGGADYTWEQVAPDILGRSPELAAALIEINRAQAAYERARVEAVPNVQFQGLINVIDNGIGGRPDGAVQVQMPIPLWNRNQGGIFQAQSQIGVAERAYRTLELSIQNRLAGVFERYSSARYQVERYREKILPASKESLDIAIASFKAGETGYLNLLTAQRTYSQTNVNYLDALRELRQAEAQIQGLLLSGSLDQR